MIIMSKANVYALDGKIVKQIDLPTVFDTPYRPDVIKRTVLALQSHQWQAKGNKPMAGRLNSAQYRGNRKLASYRRIINMGVARKPRLKNRRYLLYGRVAGIPGTVGGPESHPPKTEKNIHEWINDKERNLGTKSALAATGNKKIVEKRSNQAFQVSLPIVLENNFENLKKTSQVLEVLEKLSIANEVEKAKDKKRIRSGKGKKRGRKYKRKKSVLFIVGKKEALYKAAKNLEGTDVVTARQVNAMNLAPGTQAGRLSIFTEQALIELQARFK